MEGQYRALSLASGKKENMGENQKRGNQKEVGGKKYLIA